MTGLDFSAVAVAAARDLAGRAGLAGRARFVCADVYDAVEAREHQVFDIVYVTLGALCWLPSVERWAEQVSALLGPGARLYLHDVHPLAWAFAEDQMVIENSYFQQAEPYVDDTGTTYTDEDSPVTSRRSLEWNHGIGETVTALVDQGLRIDLLCEHDWTLWPRFAWLVQDSEGHWSPPPDRPRVPLSFTIVASAARR